MAVPKENTAMPSIHKFNMQQFQKTIFKDGNNYSKDLFPPFAPQPIKKDEYNKLIFHPKIFQLPIPFHNTQRKTRIEWAAKTVPGINFNQQTKTNQDYYTVIEDFLLVHQCTLALVCDGHGVNGHHVSKFACNNLPCISITSDYHEINRKRSIKNGIDHPIS